VLLVQSIKASLSLELNNLMQRASNRTKSSLSAWIQNTYRVSHVERRSYLNDKTKTGSSKGDIKPWEGDKVTCIGAPACCKYLHFVTKW